MSVLNVLESRLRNAALQWLFKGQNTMPDPREQKKQSLIALARRYYDGDQTVYLTNRQKAWLDLHGGAVRFNVNVCATVVDSVLERLKVTGFKVPQSSEVQQKAWRWWEANRMDALQTEAHRLAVRDGESFMLATWDETAGQPVFVLHPRFVDPSIGGDGFGMWMDYPNDDPFAKPLRAVKRWEELDEHNSRIQRMTVYYPNRIERFFSQGAGIMWEKYVADGQDWPTPWVMPDGTPIGIPVVHLRNPGLGSDLRDVIPLQDALNKSWLDLMAASDTTAFRMFATFGWVPTTDGKEPAADRSNLLQVAPGQMFGTTKKPGDASIQVIEAADMKPLLDTEERIIFRIASVSKTPLSYFIATRQIAGEGTVKQQEGPLVKKVEAKQTLLGNGWEDLVRISLRLEAAFGGGVALPDEPEIETVWEKAETRDEDVQTAIAVKKRKDLNVPVEVVWAELGYSAEQIETMRNSPDYQAHLANLKMASLTIEELNNGDQSTSTSAT